MEKSSELTFSLANLNVSSDCVCGSWSAWSVCQSGSQSRSRLCLGPFQGGKSCNGSSMETLSCDRETLLCHICLYSTWNSPILITWFVYLTICWLLIPHFNSCTYHTTERVYILISVMQYPTIEDLLNPYNDISGIDIIYQEHNFSFSSESSL